MPRYSHRTSTIRKLRNLFLRRLKFAVIRETALIEDSDENSIDDFVALSLVDFRSRRYSQDRGPYKRWNWRSFLEHTQQLSDTQFLLLFRMQRESFDLLQDLLKDHLVFCRRTGPAGNLLRQQYPVQLQIMVFLYFKRIGARFFISQGAGRLFVTRVTTAVLSLKDELIKWPDAEERNRISSEILLQYGFPNCVGIINGTLLKLQYSPLLHPENYHCRKGFAAVSALIICDHTCRINHLYVGWPGSTHDNRIWWNSRVFCYLDEYFN
jgi:hypothetical protein